jgi:hypothetical protein
MIKVQVARVVAIGVGGACGSTLFKIVMRLGFDPFKVQGSKFKWRQR